MSRETFTWSPEWESTLDEKPNVTVTQFGDGYEARVPLGINNTPQRWTLQFSQTGTQASSVLAFLRARGGVTPFNWTTPLNETGVFVCREWKMQRKQGVNVIQVDFEQVFEA